MQQKEHLPFVTAWMELKSIMLSEVNQAVKKMYLGEDKKKKNYSHVSFKCLLWIGLDQIPKFSSDYPQLYFMHQNYKLPEEYYAVSLCVSVFHVPIKSMIVRVVPFLP